MSFGLSLGLSPRVDVLVVDDNPFIRAAVARILQRGGRRIVAVGTIDDAKMTILDHPPSCVLTDFSLADQGTGVDLLRWIREQPGLEALPCGIISGSDRCLILEALRAAKLDTVPILGKPFGLGELEVWFEGLAPRPRASRWSRRVP